MASVSIENYNTMNNYKTWLVIYNDDQKKYTIVPHAFILGHSDEGVKYGQFISTLWYSERATYDKNIKYTIVSARKSVQPYAIENYLNRISSLNDNDIEWMHTYSVSLENWENLEEGSTKRVDCNHTSSTMLKPEKHPEMSIHLRRIEDDQFYVSLPYFAFTE